MRAVVIVQQHVKQQQSANVTAGKTVDGWTKMTLGMEVGLVPGDYVFDGDPATLRTEGTPTTTQWREIVQMLHVQQGV